MSDDRPQAPETFPIEIVVFCDGCGIEVGHDYVVHDLMTREERLGVARNHMRRNEGWTCTPAGDFCPECQPGAKPETIAAPCQGVHESLAECGEPSFATIVTACMHEHVDRLRACAGCALEAQMMGAPWTCRRCRDDARQPHECDARVVIEWDSGEKTIVQEAS